MLPLEVLADISCMLLFCLSREAKCLLLPYSANLRFSDSVGGKPWVDGDPATAARDFWMANETWLATWGAGDARGMTVKSVKMWQQGACS
jgi:hypothetical protein